jgi:two-component system response regulator DevR
VVVLDLKLSPSGETDGPTRLTPREREVLGPLRTGASNREVAEQLFISETTARFHVGNLMRKLDVSRRSEAASTATRQGLI